MEEIEWNRIGFENIGMKRTVWKYGGKERLKNISQMFEECFEVVYSDWRMDQNFYRNNNFGNKIFGSKILFILNIS